MAVFKLRVQYCPLYGFNLGFSAAASSHQILGIRLLMNAPAGKGSRCSGREICIFVMNHAVAGHVLDDNTLKTAKEINSSQRFGELTERL